MPKIGFGSFMPISCQAGAKMQDEQNYWHRDGITNLSTPILVVDSDYAAKVFHFIKDKSTEELHLFHWKRNFDLYTLVHSSYHYWSNRSIEVKVIKSHNQTNLKPPVIDMSISEMNLLTLLPKLLPKTKVQSNSFRPDRRYGPMLKKQNWTGSRSMNFVMGLHKNS